jgi:hypothetical protein
MLSFLKYTLIIWSLTLSQLAIANDTTLEKSTETLITTLNQNISSKQSLLDFAKKGSPEKYEELKKFMTNEKLSDSFQIPQLKYQSGKFAVVIDKIEITFEPRSIDKILVIHGNKSIEIDSNMSLTNTKKTIATLFTETPKTSLLNYIINTAQAQTLIVEYFIAAAIVSAIIGFIAFMGYAMKKTSDNSKATKNLSELVKSSKEICTQLESSQGEVVAMDSLMDSYNLFSKNYSTFCSAMADVLESRKAICNEAQAVKKCLKDSINKISQVSNAKRNDAKEIIYDVVNDKYIATSASK